MKHFEIVTCFDSTQVKWYMKSSTKNVVHELPVKFPNNLRLRILGNQEIVEKFQKWVKAELSTQPPFQEKIFVTSGQNLHKNRYQGFLSGPVLFDFLKLCH